MHDLTQALEEESSNVESPFNRAKIASRHRENTGSSGELGWEFHHQVFTIFRNSKTCARCQANVEMTSSEDVQNEGDFVCPHVSRKAYEEIRQKSLDGIYKIGSINELFTKDGDVLISVSWASPKAKKDNNNVNSIKEQRL